MNDCILTWTKKPLLIVGHGRSGKDAAGSYLSSRCRGLKYCGSLSWFALPHIAKALDIAPQIAWEQRHDNRKFWYDECNWLRRDDPLFLVRLALQQGNLITGMRDRVELDIAKREGIFSHILWIYRPDVPTDSTLTFSTNDATDILWNTGTLEKFHDSLDCWLRHATEDL
jgi:hypothetical protein